MVVWEGEAQKGGFGFGPLAAGSAIHGSASARSPKALRCLWKVEVGGE